MLSLNCQSINAKFDKLIIFLDDVNKCHPKAAICIQESWGHEEMEMSYFSLPNYLMVFKNRRLSTHGWLILYIHNDFAYKELSNEIAFSYESNLFESMFVEIFRKLCSYQKYILGNVYRLPLYGVDDLSTFTNEFITLLNLLKARSNFVYICGDYTIDISKMSSNHAYNTFYENIISCSFAPKITLPTTICETASTLIDNVYTNVLDKSHRSGIQIRHISDHQMYFCIMNENFGKSATHKKHMKLSTVSLLKNFKRKLLTWKCTINWTKTSIEILITIMKLLRLYCKMQKIDTSLNVLQSSINVGTKTEVDDR